MGVGGGHLPPSQWWPRWRYGVATRRGPWQPGAGLGRSKGDSRGAEHRQNLRHPSTNRAKSLPALGPATATAGGGERCLAPADHRNTRQNIKKKINHKS